MKRFINLIMVIITGAFVLLYFSYRNERNNRERLLEQSVKQVDLIFDLEEENNRLMEYVMELETDNSILLSCCSNGGLDADTSFTQ